MKRLILISLLTSIIKARDYNNPIAERAPDPWIVYYNGNYHLIATTGQNYFRIRKSSTLGRLKTAENKVVYSISGYQGWAPEIHQIGEKWYLYYAACEGNTGSGCHRNHVAESQGDDPMGPYSYKGDLVDPADRDQMQMDPSLIKINGKLYLLGAVSTLESINLYIIELSNPYTVKGHKTTLSTPTFPWEKHGGPVNVGPEALYVGNKTYVVFSASTCGNFDSSLGLLEFVGTDPLNKDHWRKNPEPVFQKNDKNKVYSPGQNGFFRSPDGSEYWIVYHANDSPNGGCDDNRSTRAQRFNISKNGVPVFGEPVNGGEVPSGEA